MHLHCGYLISNFKSISFMDLTQTNALRNIQEPLHAHMKSISIMDLTQTNVLRNIQEQSHLMQAHMNKNFSLGLRRFILTRSSVSNLEKVGGDIKFMQHLYG